MSTSTEIESNSLLENPVFERDKSSLEVIQVLNSINTEIEKRKNINDSDNIEVFSVKSNDITNSVIKSDFILPNFFIKRTIDIKNYFLRTQKWIGHVIEIKKNVFIAKLEDLNSPNTYEIGEFDIDEVSHEDIELLKEGAVFYWSVGHAVVNGQVIKQSLIRFQRVSEWSETDIDDASDRAMDLFKNLSWE